jgi:hypothetical protein
VVCESEKYCHVSVSIDRNAAVDCSFNVQGAKAPASVQQGEASFSSYFRKNIVELTFEQLKVDLSERPTVAWFWLRLTWIFHAEGVPFPCHQRENPRPHQIFSPSISWHFGSSQLSIMAQTQTQTGVSGSKFQDKEKPMEVRRSNITAAKGFFSIQDTISISNF